MKLLVTGGAGYIGGVTTALLVEAGHDVTVIDDLSRGHRDAVHEGATFVQGDLLEAGVADKVMDGAGFDAVLHFAAKIEVGESAKEPGLYFRHNLTSALNVVEAARKAGVKRIIASSTAATYGAPTKVPIEETDPTVPVNAYGASKLAMDQLLTFGAEAYGFSAVSLRYFNVAGAHGEFGERHDPETHLIPNLLKAAQDPNFEFKLFGTDFPTVDGTCVRDYVHVEDLAAAHILALSDDVAAPGKHEIFNLGSGAGFSVRQVLEAARKVTGAEIRAAELPRRAGDPPALVASSEKAQRVLGWKQSKPEVETMIADAWGFMQGQGEN